MWGVWMLKKVPCWLQRWAAPSTRCPPARTTARSTVPSIDCVWIWPSSSLRPPSMQLHLEQRRKDLPSFPGPNPPTCKTWRGASNRCCRPRSGPSLRCEEGLNTSRIKGTIKRENALRGDGLESSNAECIDLAPWTFLRSVDDQQTGSKQRPLKLDLWLRHGRWKNKTKKQAESGDHLHFHMTIPVLVDPCVAVTYPCGHSRILGDVVVLP